LLKLTAVGLVWGFHENRQFWDQLLLRVNQDQWGVGPAIAARLSAIGITVETIQSSRFLATLYAALKVLYYSFVLAHGSRLLGFIITVGGPILTVISGIYGLRRASTSSEIVHLMIMLVAAFVPVFWYLLFLNHTIIHPFYMVRPMIWPAVIAAILTYDGWLARHRLRTSPPVRFE
jgi:hypothetical protein